MAPCRTCLYRLGDAAGRPEVLTDGEIIMLLEMHGDRVELIIDKARSGKPIGQHWKWLEHLGDYT